MNLTTQVIDVWKPATEIEKLQALECLAVLPRRTPSSADFERDVFMRALIGTTRYGLAEAMDQCLQGKHGHTFHPNTAELRRMHDEAMAPHYRALERRRLEANLMAERASDRPKLSEAEKARQVERMRAFHARFAKQDAANDQAEFEARCLANGMTPEALAKIPDAKPSMRQVMDRT